jgi:hypothetical protein
VDAVALQYVKWKVNSGVFPVKAGSCGFVWVMVGTLGVAIALLSGSSTVAALLSGLWASVLCSGTSARGCIHAVRWAPVGVVRCMFCMAISFMSKDGLLIMKM